MPSSKETGNSTGFSFDHLADTPSSVSQYIFQYGGYLDLSRFAATLLKGNWWRFRMRVVVVIATRLWLPGQRVGGNEEVGVRRTTNLRCVYEGVDSKFVRYYGELDCELDFSEVLECHASVQM